MLPFTSLAERFAPKVDRSAVDGCWPWIAARDPNGYGRIGLGGKRGQIVLAHRVAWELANGPIPPGKNILHRCDNPPCCNPAHLFPGTQADNVHDMVSKGRASKHRAMFVGEKNPTAKLTDAQRDEARERRARSETFNSIALSFGVTKQAVMYICKRGKR